MRKNILYISDTGKIIGGGEISLLNLLENLDKEAFRPVAAVPGEGDWARRVRELGIPLHLFGYKKLMNPLNFSHTVSSVRTLCGIIRKENIDLVHTNSTGGVVFLAGIACRLTKRPLVSHIRLIDTGFLQDFIQGVLSAKIVIISKRVGKKAGFVFFRKKPVLIYNGVDLDRFNCRGAAGDFRKKLNIPEGAPLIGTAGAYVRGKGLEYLVKAAGLLKSQIPDLRVITVGFQSAGNKEYVESLKRMAKKEGVGGMIYFLDRTDDMPGVFNALDVFVFPSLNEPFGRVLIEAMACEKPVVAFESGAVPESVNDGATGFLVKPADYRGLAEKILILLRDRQTAWQFGKNGRDRCMQLFDIKTHAQNIRNLYMELLKDSSAGFVVCPICEKADHEVINSCRVIEQDAKISEAILFLCRCRKCGLVFVNPQPGVLDEDPAHLYDKDYFRDYMKFHSVAENGTLQLNEPYSLRLSLIERFKKNGLLLDIGCASGEFLKSSKDAGFSVKGVDISPYACETARNKYGLDVTQGSFETIKFPERSFDVISCADVLEHARDPKAFLDEISRILKDDGVVYLAVPDFGSLHYQLMSMLCRITRKNYFVLPHHLYHFTAETLEKLLKHSGFDVLTRIASESQIRESGLRLVIMKIIFFLARLFKAKDRLVVIAGKSAARLKEK
jgi:glycosyltransferase involved in cell wall biosynthesis/2-polyprenyl-3-methyl-5-hydroxy-6-metoxy-1,4-benzoquinol methylase